MLANKNLCSLSRRVYPIAIFDCKYPFAIKFDISFSLVKFFECTKQLERFLTKSTNFLISRFSYFKIILGLVSFEKLSMYESVS
ncbi:hypothetical protein [Metamycoplasma hyosynoviae]|uniref:hypothetical protein n=1 Tax=Metamycoplasma hyosynoviae TaxID=29559 RepID=UPI00235E5454|nr:hypothetical protein [Metamycoplasma hyosynoviae]MDD1373044.1 hypothetical protein [Metamycoplasma hyosynoviae]